MISFSLFQVYMWIFILMGWIGASIIAIRSIIEIIKMVRGVK